MLRLLGLLVVVAAAFALGYYLGRHPVGDLPRTVTDISRNLFDTTLGIERNLRMRQGLMDAKSGLLQAKSDLIERNYGEANKALSQAVLDLEKAAAAVPEPKKSQILTLSRQLRETQAELSVGKGRDRKRLNEIQTELDGMLQ
jgi:hypothetical protein